MKNIANLKNQFLLAMPNMHGTEFHQSLTLICEHNDEGAMGIVVNHPLELSTIELLNHMEIPCKNSQNNNLVLSGGPVQTDRGFVIHRTKKRWESSIFLEQNIAITTSSDILRAIGREEIPHDAFIALGYAGWGPGQLEEEILANSWLSIPLDTELLFETKLQSRWHKAAKNLGFDINHLSYFSGNA